MHPLTIPAAAASARDQAETDALIIEQIAKQLEAALASFPITRATISMSPSAEHWPIVDYAVRLWAGANRVKVERNDREISGKRYISDWYAHDGLTIAWVSVPPELHLARVTVLTADEIEVRR